MVRVDILPREFANGIGQLRLQTVRRNRFTTPSYSQDSTTRWTKQVKQRNMRHEDTYSGVALPIVSGFKNRVRARIASVLLQEADAAQKVRVARV